MDKITIFNNNKSFYNNYVNSKNSIKYVDTLYILYLKHSNSVALLCKNNYYKMSHYKDQILQFFK